VDIIVFGQLVTSLIAHFLGCLNLKINMLCFSETPVNVDRSTQSEVPYYVIFLLIPLRESEYFAKFSHRGYYDGLNM